MNRQEGDDKQINRKDSKDRETSYMGALNPNFPSRRLAPRCDGNPRFRDVIESHLA
jgi:hypothetical protein